MNCREFTEFLHQYLFDDLPPEEGCEFERHLAECPWCTAYLDSYKKTILLAQKAFSANGNEKHPADAPEELIQAVLRARPRRS